MPRLNLVETKTMTYKITFTEHQTGSQKIAAVWTGFESYAAARKAIADADLRIPFTWTYSIDGEA
jgi:hypothetical protein